MSTIQKNILISLYMGAIKPVEKDGSAWYCMKCEGGSVQGPNVCVKYHESWDLLMPVVEKIEQQNILVSIIGKGCYMVDKNLESTPQIVTVDDDSKIEAVWLAVVEFIESIQNK